MKIAVAWVAMTFLAATAFAEPTPLQEIERHLGPYLSATNPLGLPLKVRALRQSPYKFWRGSKDLYFDWIKANRPAWLADDAAYVIGHGDPHFGNIGTYATDAAGALGFGPVDFDDTARVPFQTELTQGVITLRLVAEEHQLPWTPSLRNELSGLLLDAYRTALQSDKPAVELLANDAWLEGMQTRSQRRYAKEITKFIENDQFRTRIGKASKPTDLLRPYPEGKESELANSLAAAAERDVGLAALIGTKQAADIQPRIKAIGIRTRVDSAGSQGLMKLLVLVAGPNAGIDGDVLIYLKQQIPAAAERTGCIPPDPRTPGERCSTAMAAMNSPWPGVNSWCEFDGRSFWIGLKEPWSDELNDANMRTVDDLRHAAAVWGTTFGAAHRQGYSAVRIFPRLTPSLLKEISDTADAFTDWQAAQFAAFIADPRTAEMAAAAERVLADPK